MTKTNKRTIHCETCDEDEDFLHEYKMAVEMLYGMAIEMMTENPATVLSPRFRRMLADKAMEVESMHGPLGLYLRIDNLGDPIKKWGSQ